MPAAHDAHLRAYRLQRSAGGSPLLRDIIFGACLSAVFSGVSVDDFRELLDELDDEAAQAGPMLAATLAGFRARVEYGAGRLPADAVLVVADREAQLLQEAGAGTLGGDRAFERMVMPWLDGDLAAAEAGARERVEWMRTQGGRIFEANALAAWALASCHVGRSEQALAVVGEARAIAEPGDIADQLDLDLAEAYARALEGESDAPRALLERARTWSEGTEMYVPFSEHDYIEACVLRTLGDVEDARRLIAALAERETRRGFHRFADRYRRELAALDSAGAD
jgi:hypothetical protein